MPHSGIHGATRLPAKSPLQIYTNVFPACINLSDTDTENWANLGKSKILLPVELRGCGGYLLFHIL